MARGATAAAAALVLAVLAALAPAPALAGCDRRQDGYFDFFMLAIQWPAQFGHPEIGHWTLHGLWPSRKGSMAAAHTYPCSCTREEFDAHAVQGFRDQMEIFWPTLFSSNSNEHFWSHEWGKHGTCAKMANQSAYFRRTLDVRAAHAPGPAFINFTSVHHDHQVKASALTDAYRQLYGAAPMLGCHIEDGRQYLAEIGVCLGVASLTPEDCDRSVERIHDEVNNCNDDSPIWVRPAKAASVELLAPQ